MFLFGVLFMNSLLSQLKLRRIALGLKQNDMLMRVGMSRQQYQRLESKGNPRLDTLNLVAQGLNAQLLLIPNEKLAAVQAILSEQQNTQHDTQMLIENPWKNLLENE